MKRILVLGVLMVIGLPLWAGPVELGTVHWSRDYDAGLKTVKESGKPMFLLFQVVRFIGNDEKDVIPRKERVWTKKGVMQRMAEALEKAGRPVPEELKIETS